MCLSPGFELVWDQPSGVVVEGERAGRRRAPVHPRKAPEELEVHIPDNGPDPRVDVAAPPQRVEAVDGVQAAHLPRIEDPDYRTRLTDHGGMADSEQAVVEAPRVEAMILEGRTQRAERLSGLLGEGIVPDRDQPVGGQLDDEAGERHPQLRGVLPRLPAPRELMEAEDVPR